MFVCFYFHQYQWAQCNKDIWEYVYRNYGNICTHGAICWRASCVSGCVSHSLTHWFTHTHTPTHPTTTQPPTQPPTHCNMLPCQRCEWVRESLTDWQTDWLTDWLTHSLTHSLTHYSLTRSHAHFVNSMMAYSEYEFVFSWPDNLLTSELTNGVSSIVTC